MFDFKNASKQELQEQYNRIATEMGDDQFFTKKELHYLPEVLRDGEQVLTFTSGLIKGNTWLIVLTDTRIIFLDKGMIYGLKQQSIPLSKVNSISGSTGLLFGTIVITDGSGDHEIKNVWKKTVKPFTNKVEELINSSNSESSSAVNHASSEGDKYASLEKLHSLVEKGIISDDEYQKEKARVLGS